MSATAVALTPTTKRTYTAICLDCKRRGNVHNFDVERCSVCGQSTCLPTGPTYCRCLCYSLRMEACPIEATRFYAVWDDIWADRITYDDVLEELQRLDAVFAAHNI